MSSVLNKLFKPKSREVQRLQSVFDKLDVENRGSIPLRRLQDAVVKEAYGRNNELERDEMDTLIMKADGNRDGMVDRKEFVKLMHLPISSDGSLSEKALFRAADLITPINQKRQVYSYVKEYSCRPPPFFMVLISIIQVSVFLIYAYLDGMAPGWLFGCPGCFHNGQIGPLIYHPLWKQQAWRYLSYMFIHAGIEHLLGNVFLQLVLGIPLELVHKFWRVGPLYLAGVLLGSLLQSAVDPYVALVGASGGCYALLAAHLANIMLNWSEMPWRLVRLGVVTIFVSLDAGFAIYRRHWLGECDRVSYMAHIGGALAGFLLGVVVLKNLQQRKWERALWWVCLVLFVALVLTCIILNILFNPGDPAIISTRCRVKPMSTTIRTPTTRFYG